MQKTDTNQMKNLSSGKQAMQAIILAGGLGTRLRSVVHDLPKCMAPVNGIPFINFIVAYLKNEGVEKFIFSLGYQHQVITEYLDKTFPELDKIYSIETTALGTGGAIKKACGFATANQVIALNGDTMFNVNAASLLEVHTAKNAACTIALNHMKEFSRYGSVHIDKDDRITAFNEKQFCEEGLINGGVYILNVASFLQTDLPEVFSFEKDFLEKYVGEKIMLGIEKDYYFIDIGIPEDYQKFQDDSNLILSKSNSGSDCSDNFDAVQVIIEGLSMLFNDDRYKVV